jgi:hypothetical protein
VYREETAAIDQVSDRLVDNASLGRTLQMEERINGDWYRERDMITLVYMKSAFFKAKPPTITPVIAPPSDTTNNSGITVINPSLASLSAPNNAILTSLVLPSSSTGHDSVKSLVSSQSARARRLHQGGTAADGHIEVASFRVPKPPMTARALAAAGGNNKDGMATISSRRRTHNGAIVHGGGNNGSAAVAATRADGSTSTRVRLDRSGKPMASRHTMNDIKDDGSGTMAAPTSPITAIVPPLPMFTSKATHEIVEGGEWQYHIMDVYVFHELALGVNARGLAMLHNHAGPFRLLPSATVPSTASFAAASSSSASPLSSHITISSADHGGVEALASSLLNNASAAMSAAFGAAAGNGNGNGSDTINWDVHAANTSARRVRFVNRRPLHDIPFVLTALDTHAPLINADT